MNKTLLVLLVATFPMAGCKSLSQDNDCGAACRDAVVADVAGDAVGDVGRDVSDAVADALDIGLVDASGEIIIDPPPHDCWACDNSDDCKAGYECLPVGAGKHCLRRCGDDGDCLSGFICYESVADKFCLPISYSCPACFYDTPCDEGFCCDLNTGSCKDCKYECQACSYDYDCAAGMRCRKADGDLTGRCVPECADGICPDPVNQTCTDNGRGVMLCVVNKDYCLGRCFPPTPHALEDGSCVECVVDLDCEAGDYCDPADHVCRDPLSCPEGQKRCDSGQCLQCCTDADCSVPPFVSGKCLAEGHCDGPFFCGLCSEDFPYCAVIDGVEQCVQCGVDADCESIQAGCKCSGAPNYFCEAADGHWCPEGDSCSAMCSHDDDCPPASGGGLLSCLAEGSSGRCYDPAGKCDASSACCAHGQKCFDLTVMIGYLQGLEIETSGSGICECSEKFPCISTKPCTDLSILCTDEVLVAQLGLTFAQTCPDGQLSPVVPASICAEVADIVAAVPGPPTFLSF